MKFTLWMAVAVSLSLALTGLAGVSFVAGASAQGTAVAPNPAAPAPAVVMPHVGPSYAGVLSTFNCQSTSTCHATTASATGTVNISSFVVVVAHVVTTTAPSGISVQDSMHTTWTLWTSTSYDCSGATYGRTVIWGGTPLNTGADGIYVNDSAATVIGVGYVETNGSGFDPAGSAVVSDTEVNALTGFSPSYPGDLSLAAGDTHRLTGATVGFDINGVQLQDNSYGFDTTASACGVSGYVTIMGWENTNTVGPYGSNLTFADGNLVQTYTMVGVLPSIPPASVPPPSTISVVNSTGDTLTVTWSAATSPTVTGYPYRVYASLDCSGSIISSGTFSDTPPLTATITGLMPSTPYSVAIYTTNATGTGLGGCGSSANGAGVTTSPYVGWTYWFRSASWTNYTLPTASGATQWPGTRAFFVQSGGFDSPVVSYSNPSGVPEIYYIAATGYLAAYNEMTQTASVLPGQGVLWLPPTGPVHFVFNGQGSQLMPYINPDNEVTSLFDCTTNNESGATSPDLYIEQYWLTNGTESVFNTTVPVDGIYSVSCGVMNNGWFFYVNDTSTQMTVVNIFSHATFVSSASGVSAWNDWNSALWIPSTDQVLTDVNNHSAPGVDVRAFSFDPSGDTFSVRTMTGMLASVTGTDPNNLNYYYRPMANGTMQVYGYGENDYGASYHLLNIGVDSTSVALDYIIGLNQTGLIGTTDSTNVALPAAQNFTINGAYQGLGNEQAPLMDPLTNTSVWDAGNSSLAAWFNEQFVACIAFCVTNPWAGAWTFVPGIWNQSTEVLGDIEIPTGTGSAGGVLQDYLFDLNVTVGIPTPPSPPPPVIGGSSQCGGSGGVECLLEVIFTVIIISLVLLVVEKNYWQNKRKRRFG